jgi:hypothetical protein
MVVIRPTADLAKRMGTKLSAINKVSNNLLGDWYAIDIVLDHKQYILCVCENGRLPVVLKAAPYASFSDRLPFALSQVLQLINIPSEKRTEEINLTKDYVLAKTMNRSVLGSMNDFRFALQTSAQIGRLENDPLTMSLWLVDQISLILPEGTPRDSVLKIFGEPSRVRQMYSDGALR